MSELDKQDRIEQARKYLKELTDSRENIRDDEIRDKVAELIRSLRNLRDSQYLFDSGERQLVQLYARYLPYLIQILDEYIRIENSGNYEAVRKARSQLSKTLTLLNSTIREIEHILPQDEMDNANAQAKADQIKKILDEASHGS